MKSYAQPVVHTLIYGGITLLLAGLQTTLWFQLFGNLTPPMFWLVPCLYLSLYRSTLEAILAAYLIAVLVAPFTVMPLGVLLTVLILLVIAGSTLKRHVYWKGIRIFANFTFFSVFAFQVLYLLFSWFFEQRAALELNLVSRILQAILTYFISFPLFYLFRSTDDHFGRYTERELEMSQ